MGTFFRSNSDDSVVFARKNSELNPSPLSQRPTEEGEEGGEVGLGEVGDVDATD